MDHNIHEAAAVLNNNVEIAIPWENDNDLNLIHTTASFLPIADSNVSTLLDDEFFDIMQTLCNEDDNNCLFDDDYRFGDREPVALALPVCDMIGTGIVVKANVVNVSTGTNNSIFSSRNCIDLDNNVMTEAVTATTAAYSSTVGATNVISTIPLVETHKNLTSVTDSMLESVTAMLSYAHVEGQVEDEDDKNEKMVDDEYDYGFILEGIDEADEENHDVWVNDQNENAVAIADDITNDGVLTTSSSFVSVSAALKNKLSMMNTIQDEETKSNKKSRKNTVFTTSSSSSRIQLLSDEETKTNRSKAKAKWMKKKERLRAKILLAASAVKDCFTTSSSSSTSNKDVFGTTVTNKSKNTPMNNVTAAMQNHPITNNSTVSSVLTVSLATVVAVGGEEMQWNKARKAAAAKRERVNGKFKRCQTKWMGVSDYYYVSSSCVQQQNQQHQQSVSLPSAGTTGGSSMATAMDAALSNCNNNGINSWVVSSINATTAITSVDHYSQQQPLQQEYRNSNNEIMAKMVIPITVHRDSNESYSADITTGQEEQQKYTQYHHQSQIQQIIPQPPGVSLSIWTGDDDLY